MKLPIHVDLDGYAIADNCLAVGGRKITEIVKDIGSTPAYIYDARKILHRIKHLRKEFPKELELHYAIKANPMPEVVKLIAKQVDGLDVASAGELELALHTGIPPKDISFAGPAKSTKELQVAVSSGITLNVESPNELVRLSKISEKLGKKANVAIRVNPDFELKSSGMKMSGGPKPFGIDAEKVPGLLQGLNLDLFSFQGLHIFSGSQNLNPESICETQRKTVDLAIQLLDHAPQEPKFVNIGGGLGIPYFPGDEQLDLSLIGTNLSDLSNKLARYFPAAKMVVELGRYIVGEAGIYVCRVIDKKESRGSVFLLTNGGLHHHLAASGNFGQIIRKNYPIAIGNRMHADTLETVNIVGPLCTPLDILADKMALPTAGVDDLVVVFQSGAYGLTASPTRFLGHPSCKEILISDQIAKETQ